MNSFDKDILFTALGFLAVVLKGKKAGPHDADDARKMCELIRAFCEEERPEYFEEKPEERAARERINKLANIIAAHIRRTGACAKEDLTVLGLGEEDLKHWNLAYALAQVDRMRG